MHSMSTPVPGSQVPASTCPFLQVIVTPRCISLTHEGSLTVSLILRPWSHVSATVIRQTWSCPRVHWLSQALDVSPGNTPTQYVSQLSSMICPVGVRPLICPPGVFRLTSQGAKTRNTNLVYDSNRNKWAPLANRRHLMETCKTRRLVKNKRFLQKYFKSAISRQGPWKSPKWLKKSCSQEGQLRWGSRDFEICKLSAIWQKPKTNVSASFRCFLSKLLKYS